MPERNTAGLSIRTRYLLKKFGITEEQYDALLRAQDGCCAVCHRPATTFRKRLAVDHDHESGLIRGLLCLHCNRYVVGRHRRERGADLLLAAYQYLVKDYPGYRVPKKVKRLKKWKKKKKRSRQAFG